jgi:hypothetical protein
MEEAFSVRSVPELYNEDQLPLRDRLETGVTRLGGWCEVAGMVESFESCSCEKLVAEAWESSGTQRKGKVRR